MGDELGGVELRGGGAQSATWSICIECIYWKSPTLFAVVLFGLQSPLPGKGVEPKKTTAKNVVLFLYISSTGQRVAPGASFLG